MRRTPAPTLCLTPDRRSRPGHRAGRVRSGFPRVFSHGYLTTSGLPTLVADYAQNVTVEGDTYLLTQQTGRYLLKMYEQGRQVRLAASCSCLRSRSQWAPAGERDR